MNEVFEIERLRELVEEVSATAYPMVPDVPVSSFRLESLIVKSSNAGMNIRPTPPVDPLPAATIWTLLIVVFSAKYPLLMSVRRCVVLRHESLPYP